MQARGFVLGLLFTAVCSLHAAEKDSVVVDTIAETKTETVAKKKPSFMKRLNMKLDKLLRSFSEKDTNYIEPQHYHFAAMLQQTEVFQYTRMEMNSGHKLKMSPDVVFKAGPYFGYKWLFFGYQVDLKNLMKSAEGTYFDLSFYSNQIGLDLYYIDNGSNFKIRSLDLGQNVDTSPLKDQKVQGLSERFSGFNIYYITNHKKYSYPAAFNQCTQQKRSAASALVGIGYSRHKFKLDYTRFKKQLEAAIPNIMNNEKGENPLEDILGPEQNMDNVDYRSYTLTGGWGYNWVFAHNWLLGGSYQAGISYNVTNTQYEQGFKNIVKNMSFKNVSFDSTIRFGLVYNNSLWYAGMSSILHNYNYRTDAFWTSNLYGTLNLYVGLNFDIYIKKKRI